MVTWFCVTPERRYKTTMILSALAARWPGARLIEGPPPDDGRPFVVWGQLWLAMQIMPMAAAQGRPFWHVDNGYWRAARGGPVGYYRVTYRGLSPVMLERPPEARRAAAWPVLQPWRTKGANILLALPGDNYGRCVGLDMHGWFETIGQRIRAETDRPVILRKKASKTPLSHDFANCWAVVTHSSNVAVDAAIAGLPVFVAPTCPAAPVGNLSLKMLECPAMPDRSLWLASLMSQQFTIEEMKDGTAFDLLVRVQEQFDKCQQPMTARLQRRKIRSDFSMATRS